MRKLLQMLVFSALIASLTVPAALAEDMFQQEVTLEKNTVIAANLTMQTLAGGYKLVTTEELKKWMDDGKKVVIVDTMPFEASYAKSHVPGAKQFLFPIPDMPEWDVKETDGKSQADFEKLLGPDKDATIVIYCGFVKCTRSHNGALWAKKLGYKHVYRFPGGIYAWKGAGFKEEAVK